jgi:hypothetical protein
MPTIIQSIGVSGDFGSMSLNDPSDGVAISSTGSDGAASDFSLTDLANSIFIKEFQSQQYKIGINKTFDTTQYVMDVSGDLRIDTGPSGDRQGGHLRIQTNTQNFPGPNKIVMYEAPFNPGQTPTTSIGIGVDTNTMKFHTTSDYKWYYNANGTWNYIKDASGNNISVGKMPTSNGNLAMQLSDNDLSLNGNLNINGNSVNFSQPSVKFSIDQVFDFSDASCALILPTGTTSDRSLTTNVNGMVRYNYQTKKIEQYVDGWSGLKAAVADVDGDTFISAEEIVGNQPQDNDQLHFYTRGNKRMLIDNDGKIAIGNVSTDPSSNLHIFSGGTFTSNNIPAFGITAMTGSDFSANAGTTFPFMNLQTAAGTDYLRLNVINYNTGVTGTEDQVSFTGFGVSVKDGSNGFIDNAMVVHPKGNVGFGTILPNAKLHVRNTTNNNPNQPAILLEYAGNDNFINLNNISGTSSIHGIKFLKSNSEQFTISGSDTSFNIIKGNKTPLFIDLSLNRTAINHIVPIVSLDISGTDAIKIPVGTSAQRPSATDINQYGLIRYNTTTSSYEGFGAGNSWGSLGGIKDVDQDTYITAENSAGADNDQLKFFTSSTEKMIIDTNGNVGIGTNNPSNTLTINGTSTDTLPILGLRSGNAHNVINNGAQIAFGWSETDQYQHFIHTRHSTSDTNLNAIDFFLCDNTANNTVTSGSNHALTLTGSGRVGVGVTNPTVALDVNGSIKFTGSMLVSGGMTSDADYITSSASTSHDVIFKAGTTERFRIKGDGNVGIGTITPQSKLDVNGSIRAAYNTDTTSYFGRAAIGYTGHSNWASFAHVSSNTQDNFALLHNSSGQTIINTSNSQHISFRAGNVEKMNLSASGNLGIGTNSAASKLHVKYDGTGYSPGIIIENNGTSTGDNDANLELKSNDTGEPGIMFTHQGTRKWLISGGGDVMSGDFHVDDRENNKRKFMISKTTGYIGIGDDVYTLNPAVSFVINSNDAIQIPVGTTSQRPTANSANQYGYIRYNTTTSSYEGFGAGNAWGSLGGIKDVDQDTYISAETSAGADNDQLKFFTANNERMIINSNGKIGIGTNNPSKNLHIYGSDNTSLKIENQGSSSFNIIKISRVSSTQYGMIAEIKVWINGSNVATSGSITATAHYGSDVASRAIDNNIDTNWTSTNASSAFDLQLQLSQSYDYNSIQAIEVWSKNDYNTYNRLNGLGLFILNGATQLYTQVISGNPNGETTGGAVVKFIGPDHSNYTGTFSNGFSTTQIVNSSWAQTRKKYTLSSVVPSNQSSFTIDQSGNDTTFNNSTGDYIFNSGNVIIKGNTDLCGNLTVAGVQTGSGSVSGSTITAGDLSITTGKLSTTNVDITLEPKGSSVSTGEVIVKGDLRVDGSLNLIGEVIRTDTNVKVTDQFEITNDGTGPALKVSQTGTNDIAEFFDDGVSVFKIEDGGNIGIGTNNPSEKLHIFSTSDLMVEAKNITANSYVGFKAQGEGGNISITRFNASYTTTGAEIADSSLISTGTGDTNGFNLRSYASHNTAHMRFYTGGNNERMTIASGGNIGIGTNNPNTPLHVFSNATGLDMLKLTATNGQGHSSIVLKNDTGGQFFMATTGTGWSSGTNKLVFGSGTTGSANTKMTMLANGNVGIGQTNPQSVLDVNGTIRAAYDADTTSYFGRAAIGYGGWTDQASFSHIDRATTTDYAFLQSSVGKTMFNSSSGQSIVFKHNNDDKMTLTSGNLGIGTDAPAAKLDVYGSIKGAYNTDTTSYFGRAAIGYNGGHSDHATFAHLDQNTNTTYALMQHSSGRTMINTTSHMEFRVNDTSTKMFLHSSGNFGIGTGSNPAEKLHVNGNIKLSGSLITSSVELTQTELGYLDGATSNIQTQLNSLLSGGGSQWTTVNTNDIHYSSGNVGIGKNNPSTTLDVSGTITASNKLGIGIINPSKHLHIGGNANTSLKIENLKTFNIVKVHRTTSVNALYISELQIWINGTNVATSGTTSADVNGTYASNAIDNNHNTLYNSSPSTTSTGWEIELAQSYPISSIQAIQLWARRDYNLYNRINNFEVIICDNDTIQYRQEITGNNNGNTWTNGGAVVKFTGPDHSNYSGSFATAFSTTQIMDDTAAIVGSTYTISNTPGPSVTIDQSGNNTTFNNSTGDYIFNSGNVGIGTTNPSQKLELTGNVLIKDGTTYGYGYHFIDTNWGMTTDGAALTFKGWFSNQSSRGFHFVDATNSGNNRLVTFTGQGNVGIGSNTPTQKLDVAGNIKSTGNVSAAYNSNTTSYFGRAAIGYNGGHSDYASFAHLDQNTNTTYALMQHSSGATYINTTSHIEFRVNDTSTKMFLHSSGNLGIGAGSNPAEKLTVGGNIKLSGSLITSSVELTQTELGYLDGVTSNIQTQLNNASKWTTVNTNEIYYTAGNVGIGTNDPTSTLDVNGSIRSKYDTDTSSYFGKAAIGYIGHSDQAAFSHVDTHTSSAYALIQNNYGQTNLNAGNNQKLRLCSNGGAKLTVLSNGNVGIADDSPSYKLDVDGDINYTGNLRQNGTIVPPTQWTTVNTNEIYYNSGNVGIGTNNPSVILQVGSDVSDDANRIYDANALKIVHPTGTSNTVLNDPKPVLYLARQGTGGNSYGSLATFSLSRWEHDSNYASRTRLDIDVTDDNFVDTKVMTLRGDGRVGIGITNPTNTLTINGSSSTTPPLGLRSGTGWNSFVGGQIAFGYDGTNDYQHFIHTRHHATNSNLSAMDFFINDTTQVNTLSSGSTHALTLTGSGNVGIGRTTPNERLDVSGNIVINNGATGTNQGGRLIFDPAINATGPNKIKFLNTTDERFGIGLFTDEVRYFTSAKHSFQYQPPDVNYVKYIKLNQAGQSFPIHEVSLYQGTTDIAQGKTTNYGTNNPTFSNATSTTTNITDNDLTTFHRVGDSDNANYYITLDDNTVFNNLSAIVIRGLNRGGGDVLTKRFSQGNGTNFQMTLFDSNFNQVWLAPPYQGNGSTIFHTVHVFALAQYNSSNFTTYSKNNTSSVTASYSYSAPSSLPTGVTPSLVEQIKFDTDTVTIPGNLVVSGTTTTVNSTNTTISDSLIELSSGLTGAANNDAGIIIERGSTGDNAFMGWDESTDKFIMGTTTDTGSNTGNLTITKGDLELNNLSATTVTLNGTDLQTKIDNATSDITTFVVTIATKTNSHPQYGNGSTSAFFLNGIEAPAIQFKSGKTYTFDQSHASNNGNQLKLWTDEGSTTQYSTGVTFNGTAGSSGSNMIVVVSDSTPLKLFYQNGTNKYLGNYAATEVAVTGVTNTHLSYANHLDGVSSNIQTQLNSLSSAGGSQWTTVNTNEIHYSSGNVGIGTNNPTEKLDVRGNIYSTGSGQFTGGSFNSENSPPGVYLGALSSTYGNMQIISSNAQGGWIDWTDNISGSGSDFDGRIRYGTGGSDYAGMTFYTDSNITERMKIDLNGNVGINTSSPVSTLDVNGIVTIQTNSSTGLLLKPESTSARDSSFEIRGSRTSDTSSKIAELKLTNYDDDLTDTNILGSIWGQVTDDTNNYGSLNFGTASNGNTISTRMTILPDGKVGIATATPQSELDVNGSIRGAYDTNITSYFGRAAIGYGGWSDQASFAHIDRNTTTDYAFLQSSVGKTMFNSSSDQPIVFKHNNDDKMTLTSGNLGIGTNAPTSKLHVKDGILSLQDGYSASQIIYRDNFTSLPSDWTTLDGSVTAHTTFTRLVSGASIRSPSIDLSANSYYRDTTHAANKSLNSSRVLLKILGRSYSLDSASEMLSISILNASDNSVIDIIYKDCNANSLNDNPADLYFYPIVCDLKPYITPTLYSIKIQIDLAGGGSADYFELKEFTICMDDTSPWYKNSVYKQQVIGGLSVGHSYIGNDLSSNQLIVQGNLGIGTTNPTEKLHVVGNINSTASIISAANTNTMSQFGYMQIGSQSAYNGSAIIGHANVVNANNASAYALMQNSFGDTFLNASSTARHISFSIANSEKMRLHTNGFVGISSSDPKRTLDLSNTGQITFGNNVTSNNDSQPGIYWHSDSNYGIYRDPGSWTSNDYRQLRIKFHTGIILDPGSGAFDKSHVGVLGGMSIGDSYYTTKSDNNLIVQGNVGIGTNNPDQKLHIFSTSDLTVQAQNTTATSYASFKAAGAGGNISITRYNASYTTDGAQMADSGLLSTGTGDSYGLNLRSFATASTANIRFYTSGNNERMAITSTGNIGIANNNPVYKLDVTGDINFTGTLYQNGSAFSGGGSSQWTTVNTNEIYYSSGNVGIGTNNPSSKLDVVGYVKLSGTTHISHFYHGSNEDTYIRGGKNSSHVFIADTGSGKVNIGGGGNPTNPLTINGSNSDTVSILGLRSGNGTSTINNGAQIAFGYDGTDDYQHFIHTRHSVAGNNAIDFYVCDGTQNNTVTTGSVHNMSLNAGNVGIGTTTPSSKLDVYDGSVTISTDDSTGLLVKHRDLTSSGATIEIRGARNSSTSYKNSEMLFSNYDRDNSTTNIMGSIFGIMTDATNNYGSLNFGTAADGTTISTRMTILPDGKVGIATPTPQSELDVNGTISVTGTGKYKLDNQTIIKNNNDAATPDIYANFRVIQNISMSDGMYINYGSLGTTAADLRFYANSTTQRMIIKADTGYIGIATTTPQELLHVGNTSTNADTYIKVQSQASYKSGIKYLGANADTWHTHHDDPTNTFRIGKDTSEYLTITSDGKVGIGTIAPDSTLHIYDAVVDTSIDYTIDPDTTTYTHFDKSIQLSRSSAYRDYYIGIVGNNTTNTNLLAFAANGSGGNDPNIGMTMGSDGEVKIGGALIVNNYVRGGHNTDTTSYFGRAAIGYTGSLSDWASFSHLDCTTNSNYALLQSSAGQTILNAGTSQVIKFRIDNIDKMRLDSTGKLGIGTNNPDTLLHLYNADSNYKLKISDTDTELVLGTNVNTDAYLWIPTNHDLKIGTNDTERMRIKNSGNIGIGTDAPVSKLDVAGSIRGDYDTNTTSYFGRAAIGGHPSHNDWASFSHVDKVSAGDYCLMQASNGLTILNSSSTQPIKFRINNVDQMVLTDAGNFGIGTTSPAEKLHVNGNLRVGSDGGTTQTFLNEDVNYSFTGNDSTNTTDTFTSSNSDLASLIVGEYGSQLSTFRKVGHLTTDGGSSGNADKNNKVSAYFRETILVQGAVYIHSDSRIKTNTNELNDNSALIQFRKLKPCTYNYLDTINRTDKTVFGYIAQDVADVIPEAVSIKNDFIPNILCNVDVDLSNNYFTASNIDLGSNPYNLNTNFNDLSLNSIDSSGNQYAEIKIYTPTGKTLIRRVSNIINNTTIEFYPSIDPSIVLDPSSNNFEAFIQGQSVDDFHTLDKNSIFTLASSALQEVDRQQQADKIEIANLKTQVSSLETQMASILQRLQALENP